MKHLKQFGRGLKRALIVCLVIGTIPLWIIPMLIYDLGDDSHRNRYR